MTYVTSDLHGFSLEKFKNLLSLANFTDEDELYVLGDVIDRGEDGIKILLWLMDIPNAHLLLGNHEDMLLCCSFLFDEVNEDSLASITDAEMRRLYNWKRNGAEPTIRALKELTPADRQRVLDYVSDAPCYAKVSIGNRNFLLVHAGLGGYEKDKPIEEYSSYDLLWSRPQLSDNYSYDFITVFGHTPTAYYSKIYYGRMIKTSTWINVDTGAASGLAPMLLRLDDLREFYVKESL